MRAPHTNSNEGAKESVVLWASKAARWKETIRRIACVSLPRSLSSIYHAHGYKQLTAAMMMSCLVGCANTQRADEASQTAPTQVASERWREATMRDGGDCGVPLLLIEGMPSFDGFNAVGLPAELEPGPIEVIIKPVDPAKPRDPRTMVMCHALGPERGWVVIEQWRHPHAR